MNYPWKKDLKSEACCVPETFISVKDLSLYYKKKCAFYRVNLDIPKSCITGIIGPSGCGKSSFLHCLNKMAELNPEVKIEGDVFFDGNNIFDSRTNLQSLRKRIGIIFQEPTPLPLSIYDNIALALKEHKFDNIPERVEKALVDVGLFDEVCGDLKKSADKLSGGQKQRLCIARSIALEPEVLLLDEPCSNLDPISTEKIEELLLSLRHRFTIVIVTHNLAQARRICDLVNAFWYNKEIDGGELIEKGSAKEVFEESKNQIINDYVGGNRG